MISEEETIAVRTGENFDLQKVERYLRDHIEGIGEGPLQVRQFPAGAWPAGSSWRSGATSGSSARTPSSASPSAVGGCR